MKELNLNIYAYSGDEKLPRLKNIVITDKAIYKKELMKEEYILLAFSRNELIHFEKGDYIYYDTISGRNRFEIIDLKQPVENKNTGGYDYELRFDDQTAKWKKHISFFNRLKGNEKAWSLTSTPKDFLNRIAANLASLEFLYCGIKDGEFIEKELKELTIIHTDVVESGVIKPLSFDSRNIFDALTDIAEAWDTEWWFDGWKIHLGRCELHEDVTDFDNSVISEISQNNGDQSKYATRIYPFGSTRNIPTNYRTVEGGSVIGSIVEKRLLLPASEDNPYVDAWTDIDLKDVVEAVVVFDDVYPKLNGVMKDVSEVSKIDVPEEGDPITWTAYQFKDHELVFSSEYILPGQELRIVFQTGTLAGMDFGVTFNPKKDDESQEPELLPGGEVNPKAQVFEIVRNENYGTFLPNEIHKPKNGDTYVLYGYDATKLISGSPLENAEKELLEVAKAYVKKSQKEPLVYTCVTNPIGCESGKVILDVGSAVNLKTSALFGEEGLRSRVYGFEKRLDNPYEATYTVGETAQYSRIGNLESKVDAVAYRPNASLAGGGGSNVYVIGRTDKTSPSDTNTLSSLRALGTLLRKDRADSTYFPLSLLKGVVVREGIETDRLTVTSSITGKELRDTISTALAEDGNVDPDSLSGLLTEEGNGDLNVLSSAVKEISAGSIETGGSLGELDNVDAEANVEALEDRILVQLKGSSRWTLKLLSEIGGGGSAGGVTMKLRSLVGSALTGIVNGPVQIGYNFTSVYSDDESETGSGTATYMVNSKTVSTNIIGQGDTYFNVSQYLAIGTNKVSVTVVDSTGTSRLLNYTIEIINLAISSTFDDMQVFEEGITYKYTPVGAISKTVHFELDGNELEPVVTSVSNRQLTYMIPAQTHGNHLLKVYMTATVNGLDVSSNVLRYDLISVEAGNMTPVIASAFSMTEAKQYETLTIPFAVYDPANSSAQITLSANGVVVAGQTVDRTRQIWTYRLDKMGQLSLTIACKNVSRSFELTVAESPAIVTPETEGLELYLSSVNRSNNDDNKGSWSYEQIAATLTGFNYKTNGWVPGNDGSIALRVSGDARVEIPFPIFSKDFRSGGKTVEFEFETTDVTDYEAVIIDCMSGGIGLQITSQKAVFSSEQTLIETKFKEDERVRVSFVVEEKIENRLVYTYINGVISGVAQYPVEDNFMQKNPVNIIIGNNDCTVDIYNIRVYDNNLSQFQMLDNYVGDIDDFEKKLSVYERNQIFNDYGDVVYANILDRLPCMIITGDLPTYKGDKKTVSLTYENQQDPGKSFTADGVQIDVQGTSSQYYPRKNYKTTFKKGLTMTVSGETTTVYALRDDSIPVAAFCEKADFAESSGTHNTGMAKLVHDVLIKLDFLTPPMKNDNRVRTTVDGFPIAIFHRVTDADSLEFVGKYNFNNDKGTQDTFGLTGSAECWEVCNNTSDRVLFKSSDYSTNDWLNDFEGRYPDGNEDYTNLKILTDWIASTNGDSAKFKNEVEQHFNKNHLLFYYIMTELFAMVDQRAKNMMLASWGNEGNGAYKWYPIFYDNDTVLGINNEGANVFSYNVEYHDAIGTQNVWNGEQSVLWNNVEACFATEIEALYNRMRSIGCVSYDVANHIFDTEQSDKWCEAIYNVDSKYKYIDPLIEEGNGSYLYAAQGSRKEHRKWWLFNRFRYIDSKYTAGDFLSDYATMRLYTPTNYQGVEPDADFTIVPFADQYVRVKFGSYIRGQRSYKDEEIIIPAPDIQFNDTETIIYGASRIKSLGDLSGKYAGTIDVSKAVKLTELLIGSDKTGYSNTNLTVLSVGTNKMLRRLDIRNCPNLKHALDLSGCDNIEKIYAQGTSLTSVVLPTAGILSELYLPETISNLTIRNQPKLKDETLVVAGVENLTTLRFENMNNIDVFSLLDRCFAVSSPVLARVRLINIAGNGRGFSTLFKLTDIAGIDENGNNTPKAVVTGSFHTNAIYIDEIDAVQSSFPELRITYNVLAIRFESEATKDVCIAKYGRPGDEYFSYEDAAAVTTIKDTDFYGNNNITSFNELRYFTNIVSVVRAFRNCKNMTSITIPANVTGCYDAVFNGCTKLSSVIFEDGSLPLRVGSGEWLGGTSVETLVLPARTTVIDNYFTRGSGVKTIYIKATTPPTLAKAYGDSYENINLYVPTGCAATYSKATNWSLFKTITEYDFEQNPNNVH